MSQIKLESDDFCGDGKFVKISSVLSAFERMLLADGSPNRFQAERDAWPYIHTAVVLGKLHPLDPVTKRLSVNDYRNGIVLFAELVEWTQWDKCFEFVVAAENTPAPLGYIPAVKGTSPSGEGCSGSGEVTYKNIGVILSNYWGSPWSDLPDEQRQAWHEALGIVGGDADLEGRIWDTRDTEERQRVAAWHDAQNDPAMEEENKYWWNLNCKIDGIQREIAEWEKMNHQGIPSEARIREEKLTMLRAELSELEKRWKLPPNLQTGPMEQAPAANVPRLPLVVHQPERDTNGKLVCNPVCAKIYFATNAPTHELPQEIARQIEELPEATAADADTRTAGGPPGKMPNVDSRKMAIKAAWQIECGSKRAPLAKDVMQLLQTWADEGTEPEVLIKSDRPKRGVWWRTRKGKDNLFDLAACEKALKTWMDSRQ